MPGTSRKPFIGVNNFLDYIIANRAYSVTAPEGSGVLAGDLRSLWDGRRGTRTTVTIDRHVSTDDAYIQVDLDADAAPNLFWLDAGHNMDGEALIIQRYDQVGGFQENITASLTVGVTAGAGVALDDGSWAVDLGTPTADDRWRVLFDAATVDPTLSLMYLGTAANLGNYARSAAQDDSREVQYPGSLRSQRGVQGFGQKPVVARVAGFDYRTTLNEYDSGSFPIEDLLALLVDERSPALYCQDWSANPERMRLFINRATSIDPRWTVPGYRDVSFNMIEVL